MDCKEIKSRIFDFCDEFGPLHLNEELSQHISACEDCLLFYEKVKVGLTQMDNEKHSAINPYFTNKTLLRISRQNKPVFERTVPLRTPVYVTSILLAGILTGIFINSLTLKVPEITVDQTALAENTDPNIISDNSTLTLND